MNKKICIIIVGDLHKYPPILSFIQVLKDLKYQVAVMAAGNNSSSNYLGYNFDGVEMINIIGEYKSSISIVSKFIRMIKIRKTLWKQIKSKKFSDYLFVIVSEVTIKHIGPRIKNLNYIIYQLELIESITMLPHSKILKFDTKEIGNSAKAVIVCEYNRAHITKTWWELEQLPYILKNKPYIPDFVINNLPDYVNVYVSQIKEAAKGRQIVLYQGIISKQRPIEEFVSAISYLSDEYFFVVMANEKPKLCIPYPENYLYIPFIDPPYHLAITSMAHIGILVYIASHNSAYSILNPVYCAPNKIWEYSKFGIPMISNDNPALDFEFKNNKIGICSKSMRINDIINCIHEIEKNYHDYHQHALEFFENYDLKIEIEKIMEQIFINT